MRQVHGAVEQQQRFVGVSADVHVPGRDFALLLLGQNIRMHWLSERFACRRPFDIASSFRAPSVRHLVGIVAFEIEQDGPSPLNRSILKVAQGTGASCDGLVF